MILRHATVTLKRILGESWVSYLDLDELMLIILLSNNTSSRLGEPVTVMANHMPFKRRACWMLFDPGTQ